MHTLGSLGPTQSRNTRMYYNQQKQNGRNWDSNLRIQICPESEWWNEVWWKRIQDRAKMETTSNGPTFLTSHQQNSWIFFDSLPDEDPPKTLDIKIVSSFYESVIPYHVAASSHFALLIDESINFAKAKSTSKLSLSQWLAITLTSSSLDDEEV